MESEKVVCLDFDGTIVESVNECYLISLEALKEMDEKLENNKKNKRKFEDSRPYANKGQDFYPLLKLIERDEQIAGRDLAAIRDKLESYNERNLERSLLFEKKFYQIRDKYQQQNLQEWVNLHSLFPVHLKKIMADFNVFITTTKDEKSVKLLLDHFGFNLEESKILGRETTTDKRQQMAAVKDRADVNYKQIAFTDDLLQQLKVVSELGVKRLLASWGYNTKAQRQEANERGIKVVEKPQDLYPLLKSLS